MKKIIKNIIEFPYFYYTFGYIFRFIERGIKGYCKDDVYWTEERLIPLIISWMTDLKKMHNEIYANDVITIDRLNYALCCLELSMNEKKLWEMFYPNIENNTYVKGTENNLLPTLTEEYMNASLDIDEKINKFKNIGFKIIAEDLYSWTM